MCSKVYNKTFLEDFLFILHREGFSDQAQPSSPAENLSSFQKIRRR